MGLEWWLTRINSMRPEFACLVFKDSSQHNHTILHYISQTLEAAVIQRDFVLYLMWVAIAVQCTATFSRSIVLLRN